MNDKQGTPYHAMLREHRLKATRGRVALLTMLATEQFPLSIHAIRSRLSPKPDTVTLYRSLQALERVGLIRRVDLRHAHAHFEFVKNKKHHHHVVCTHCGLIEDVQQCAHARIETDVLHHSKKFASIHDHALELFGTCTQCARRHV